MGETGAVQGERNEREARHEDAGVLSPARDRDATASETG